MKHLFIFIGLITTSCSIPKPTLADLQTFKFRDLSRKNPDTLTLNDSEYLKNHYALLKREKEIERQKQIKKEQREALAWNQPLPDISMDANASLLPSLEDENSPSILPDIPEALLKIE